MKISQEVREFARLQDAGLLNSSAVRPEPVEGPSFTSGEEAQGSGSTSSPRTEEEAESGMAEMSKRYVEGGNELYIGAGNRTHD